MRSPVCLVGNQHDAIGRRISTDIMDGRKYAISQLKVIFASRTIEQISHDLQMNLFGHGSFTKPNIPR